MVRIYRDTWYKKPIGSFFGYLRDFIIYYLPLPRLPLRFIKLLYGVKPEYVFFVHPRRSEDIFRAFPFFTILRRFFDKQTTLKIIAKFPPIVIGQIKTPKNVNGLVVSSFFVPEFLVKTRRASLKEAFMAIAFSRKITKKKAIFGLGGWWPVVTRRGIGLKKFGEKNKLTVTNGHCGTLISLSLMLEKIATIGKIKQKDFKVAILGTGKMGTNLARALYNKVGELVLIDINPAKLEKIKDELANNHINHTKLRVFTNKDKKVLADILSNSHLAICTTTNIGRVIPTEEIPHNTIIIDDSRPEAISRDIGNNIVVLEGGLMKISGIDIGYNFGFGFDENVFGCLAETYVLALDKAKTLKPTLGDVEIGNYEKMKTFCLRNAIESGDFKTMDLNISEDRIKKILEYKQENLKV